MYHFSWFPQYESGRETGDAVSLLPVQVETLVPHLTTVDTWGKKGFLLLLSGHVTSGFLLGLSHLAGVVEVPNYCFLCDSSWVISLLLGDGESLTLHQASLTLPLQEEWKHNLLLLGVLCEQLRLTRWSPLIFGWKETCYYLVMGCKILIPCK